MNTTTSTNTEIQPIVVLAAEPLLYKNGVLLADVFNSQTIAATLSTCAQDRVAICIRIFVAVRVCRNRDVRLSEVLLRAVPVWQNDFMIQFLHERLVSPDLVFCARAICVILLIAILIMLNSYDFAPFQTRHPCNALHSSRRAFCFPPTSAHNPPARIKYNCAVAQRYGHHHRI